MRIAIICTSLLLISTVTFSQSPEKMQKIKKYMEASGYVASVKQSVESMFLVYEKNFPAVDSAFWIQFKNEMKIEDLTKLIIPVYDKYFSESDLDALIVFYQSPTGQKIRDAQPLIVKDATAIGAEWGRAAGEKLLQRMKEQGYQ